MPPTLDYLWLPFLACLVLTGIHSYLGIHVIERGVIFVDLALAQIAALGATIALLAGGFALGSGGAWFFSLGFTLLGAAVFALTRMKSARVPQEAVIGIAYAVASAASIVLVAEADDPHGAEHIRDLLAGNILYVTPWQIGKTALLYAAVGALHFACRGPFLRVTLDPEGAARDGMSLRRWDFLFYATFGFVITSSVQIAGVLLVFSFLIVPAVFATLFAHSLRVRLLLGWGLGAVVSFAGLLVSYTRPSGPVIVTLFGLTLLVAGLARYVARAPRRLPALARIGAGFAAAGLIVGLGPLLFRSEDGHEHDVHGTPAAERAPAPASAEAIGAFEDTLDLDTLLEALAAAETDADRLRYAAAIARRVRSGESEGHDAGHPHHSAEPR